MDGAVEEKTPAGATDTNGNPIEVEEIQDPEHLEKLKEAARVAPTVVWRHPSKFNSYEDKIIAAALLTRQPIYKICETIRCSRSTLLKHIEEDDDLRMIREDVKGMECDRIEEGIEELVDMRHPGVLMWKAEKLLPHKYGKDRAVEEEDDSRIVLGIIPEEELVAADRLLEEAASKPPEAGLAALLDVEAMKKVEDAVSGKQKEDSAPTLAEVDAKPLLPSPEAPAPAGFAPASMPDEETTTAYVDEFVDEFPSNDWMS